ncbi:Protein RRNAD1, partial [Lamellibrachia satsuma]
MMQVFVKCREAAALAVITCCYMKLSSERDRVSCDHVGYPMSTFTRQLANHRLNYEALEGACHFNDAYYRKLTKSSPELVSHAYRAALQEIVMEKCPSMQHGSVKLTMRKAHHMSFKEYAKVGLKRLGLATDVSESQEERAQKKLGRWREVVAFFSLRLCLLPVVETVVLLDRMLFLAQNGISSCLVPIFDPGMSPRNFVLLASK